MGEWTHAICDVDWYEGYPNRPPSRLSDETRADETCCWCGEPTRSGIYLRADPRDVPHPAGHRLVEPVGS